MLKLIAPFPVPFKVPTLLGCNSDAPPALLSPTFRIEVVSEPPMLSEIALDELLAEFKLIKAPCNAAAILTPMPLAAVLLSDIAPVEVKLELMVIVPLLLSDNVPRLFAEFPVVIAPAFTTVRF